MRLTYDLPGFTHIVRPVYIVCADDDGYFQVSCSCNIYQGQTVP